MAVHQSYELVFCFSILRNRWTGHHAGEDFVKFGDKLDKQVEIQEILLHTGDKVGLIV